LFLVFLVQKTKPACFLTEIRLFFMVIEILFVKAAERLNWSNSAAFYVRFGQVAE